jgi:hypothetical protein
MSDNFNSTDAYADILAAQNEGKACPHCSSRFGHYSHCGLINRNAGEALRAAKGEYTVQDKIIAHALGVQL